MMEQKKFFLPVDGENPDKWFGGENVVCIGKAELERLIGEFSRACDANGRFPSTASLRRCWREATAEEVERLGVFE